MRNTQRNYSNRWPLGGQNSPHADRRYQSQQATQMQKAQDTAVTLRKLTRNDEIYVCSKSHACQCGNTIKAWRNVETERHIKGSLFCVICQPDPQWSDVIIELQAAISEHNLRAANLASTATVARRPDLIVERRVGTPQRPE